MPNFDAIALNCPAKMIDKHFNMYHAIKYVDINQNLTIIDALPRNSSGTNFSETRDEFF
jgi:hypothetical protein